MSREVVHCGVNVDRELSGVVRHVVGTMAGNEVADVANGHFDWWAAISTAHSPLHCRVWIAQHNVDTLRVGELSDGRRPLVH